MSATDINNKHIDIYLKLARLVNIDNLLLTKQFSRESNKLKLSITLLEENPYYQTILITENGYLGLDGIYIEAEVRVWINQQAEAISLRQAHLNQYEEVYVKKHGFEKCQPLVKHEVNEFLFSWLTDLAQRWPNSSDTSQIH